MSYPAFYADNFRGFTKQFFRLSPLTFLVGENSSGKSSFLALAHLLLSDEFWITPGFSSLGHDLGGFGDLVSKGSRGRREFTIGVACESNRKNKERFSAVVTFVEREEALAVERCTYLRGRSLVTFSRAANGYAWKHFPIGADVDGEEWATDLLRVLVTAHVAFSASGARTLQRKGANEKYVLMTIPSLISREIIGTAHDEGDYEDFLPLGGLGGAAWFAPIRAEPRRFYERSSTVEYSPSGAHTPYLLRDVLKKQGKKGYERSVIDVLRSFGVSSGLFADLKVRKFGASAGSPFGIAIDLDGGSFHLGEVGYGVSQILPLVVELFASPYRERYFMQQPEVHLHPRAQAEIGNLLYMYTGKIDGSLLLVETHSDFIIDRVRNLIRENWMGLAESVSAEILWFHRSDGKNSVDRIGIANDGSVGPELPPGYRDFFVREDLRGLGINVDN